MRIKPYSRDGYQLMHEGAIALSRVEDTGLKVDEGYLNHTIADTYLQIQKKLARLKSSKFMKIWRDKFRSKTNPESDKQLGVVLFDVMQFPNYGKTDGGTQYKVDQATLSKIDHPGVRMIAAIKKLRKSVSFLENIEKETVDGVVHPSFNLHLVKTFRSSSDGPNLQNLPNRDQAMKRRVRKCIRARAGNRLVELDYSGVEVMTSACYNKDPVLLKYIRDPTTDMHRDIAMQVYKLRRSQVNKPIRHAAKNKFVFPEFYGDWWMSCAKNLWDQIDADGLVTEDGVPLRQHLRRKGIKVLGSQDRESSSPLPGSFEDHICNVENHFWNKRFKVYSAWKKAWYDQYLSQGYLKTLTGFICQGFMNRKEAINYAIQGSAFHILLWAMTQLVLKHMKAAGMRSRIVGQIHDSIIADVPDEELQDYLQLARHVMVTLVGRHFPWLIVTMDIEADVTPVGGSWNEMEAMEIPK